MNYYEDNNNKVRRRKVSSNNTSSKPKNTSRNIESKTTRTSKVINNDVKFKNTSRVNNSRANKLKKRKYKMLTIKKILIFLIAISFLAVLSFNVFVNISLKDTVKPTYNYLKEKSMSSEYVSIGDIPDDLQNAVISIEDERFSKHKGVDYISLVRSVVNNIFSDDTQGGSTLEMQISKNLLTSMDQTMKRKIKDMYNAKQMNKQMNKREILELYLNNIYLGKGIYGVAKGAKVYFDKDVSELNLGECALLAGITNNPGLYSKDYNLAKKRRDVILYKMEQLGYITKDEYEVIKKQETPMNLK